MQLDTLVIVMIKYILVRKHRKDFLVLVLGCLPQIQKIILSQNQYYRPDIK